MLTQNNNMGIPQLVLLHDWLQTLEDVCIAKNKQHLICKLKIAGRLFYLWDKAKVLEPQEYKQLTTSVMYNLHSMVYYNKAYNINAPVEGTKYKRHLVAQLKLPF